MRELLGKFTSLIFRNESNGYTIGSFFSKQDDMNVVVVGNFFDFDLTITYRMQGDFYYHDQFGEQFKVSKYTVILPTENDEILNFLTSSYFKGFGKVSAEKLITEYGNDVLTKLRNQELQIEELSILSLKQKESLRKGLAITTNALMQTFSGVDIGIDKLIKINDYYKEEALSLLKENPYRVIDDIDGVGFLTADKIAKELEFPMNHRYRKEAFMVFLVEQACFKKGNTFIKKDVLFKKIDFIEKEEILKTLVLQERLVVEDDSIFHALQYESEIFVSTFISRFQEKDCPEVSYQLFIKQASKLLNIEYSLQQEEAFHKFFQNNISVIIGGPGTGKTTVVEGILTVYKLIFPQAEIALCAPTGRAAKRLSELTGIKATTVHRLLQWDLHSNTFGRNFENPLEVDLLVIDEMSMVDNHLFYRLLLASSNVKKILLLGDQHQLPSVMPGDVLKDIVAVDLLPITEFKQIFRQESGSGIIDLAFKIRNLEKIDFEELKDVYFFEFFDDSLKKQIVTIVLEALEKGYTIEEIAVLSPMYRYENGIDALNKAIQEAVNPPHENKLELKVGADLVYRINDKVIHLKNQPEDDVYNGDIGYVENIDGEELSVNFQGNIVFYKREDFINLKLAYCISVHKSQGSEYSLVLMPFSIKHMQMLNRRLVYTAISRAKKNLFLLGSSALFFKGVESLRNCSRDTGLQERFIKIATLK